MSTSTSAARIGSFLSPYIIFLVRNTALYPISWAPGDYFSAVKQCKPLRSSQSKKLKIFGFPRVSPGDHPLPKDPEDPGYEIAL